MTVFIEGYGAKNYRSLGREGILLDELQDINVIIGQNNGGKTNVLRSLMIWESHRRGDPYIPIAIDYYDNDTSNQIEFEFVAPENSTDSLKQLLDATDKKPFARYRLVGQAIELVDSFVSSVNPDVLRQFCTTTYHQSSSEHITNVRAVEKHQEFNSLFALPPIIYTDERRPGVTPSDVRQKIEPIWNHGAANISQRQIKKALKDFIEEGMESSIQIQFEPGGQSFSIETNDDELTTFESLGSGFQQIFNLALKIASTKDSIVLIDEPELNMHPSLLRRMMKLIFSNQTNQYILSTHSSILLDADYEKSIYQITGGKYSTVKKCDTIEDTRELLDDLGVKASDLLQTNGIIWVEGPSDRTYIKRWLELNDTEMEEGLDYSFQFYGGKLLSHYTLDNDLDEFINVLDINKNAFIVMDSDWKDSTKNWEKTDLADRKKRVIEECESKGVPYWITSGTELENYIPNAIWTTYEASPVVLANNENISTISKRYRQKAKESHKVSSLFTSDAFKTDNELQSHIKNLEDSILGWNQKP